MAMPTASFAEPEIQRCPFDFFDQLHRDAPIYRDPITGFLVVSRYDDIVFVSQHPEIFSNTTTVVIDRKNSPVAAEVERRYRERGFVPMHSLVTNDPPSHTLYRALVDRVFSAQFVKTLEPHIEQLADGLIDDFIHAGKVDLLDRFAIRLPTYLITEQLGMPLKDWRKFKQWSDETTEAINPVIDPQRELQITDDLIEMQQYLWRRGQEYLQHPAETLLSRLMHAEIDGRRLEPREFVSVAHHLLVGGNDTTSNVIATGAWMLTRHPELKEHLQRDRALIPNYVEEALRMHSPAPHLYRQVLRDTELGGVQIKRNTIVMLSYLGANYDESKFENPRCPILDRKNARQHMAFGRGIHFCIGNQLARAELRIAFDRLLTRLPNMKLDPAMPEPRFAAHFHTHGLENLHVVF
ncbi:MAG: cytochrome P450 [Steroidobacteraceae bacterium]